MTQPNSADPAGQLKEVFGAIDRLASKASVGTVLAATQALANDLERCLSVSMPSLRKKLRDKLFSGYGPLSTFSAKVDVAYALGIIDHQTFSKLHAIRKLRNSIAHDTHLKTIEEHKDWKEVSKYCPGPADSMDISLRRFLALILEIDDVLESYLVQKGVTQDIRQKNLPNGGQSK